MLLEPAKIDFGYVAAGLALVVVIASVLPWWRLGGRGGRSALTAGSAVAAMGFTTMGLEVLLLLGFQANYGDVYHQLAIIIAAFMAGMASGGWLGLWRIGGTPALEARSRTGILLLLQVTAALCPLVLIGLYGEAGGIADPVGTFVVSHLLFPALALAAGGLGGFQFPLASGVYFGTTGERHSNPGALYAFDLIGACLGAVLLSTYLIPVFGFVKTAAAIAVVNAAPTVLIGLALSAQRRTDASPERRRR
ncbi:MAG: hypothetical protein P8181_02840 [bacterium]